MLESIIWAFTKPSAEATLDAHRIAPWLSRTLCLPLYWPGCGRKLPPLRKVGAVFFVGPTNAWTDFTEAAPLAVAARRVIFVHTDYRDKLPSPDSQGLSPWRAAFPARRRACKPVWDVWSSIPTYGGSTWHSAHVNWNAISYQPGAAKWDHTRKTLLYYGSNRPARKPYFDRYFNEPVVPTVVSGKWADQYPDVMPAPTLKRSQFHSFLAHHGLGLYIEDPHTHDDNQSPANRFYEMLSVGLPMVFQPEACDSMIRHGFDVRSFVIAKPKNLKYFMRDRQSMHNLQEMTWTKVHHEKELQSHVQKLWRKYEAETLK